MDAGFPDKDKFVFESSESTSESTTVDQRIVCTDENS